MTCSCSSPVPAPAPTEDAGCSGGEAFVLRVLGDDMEPEFREGDIIVIEPDGAVGHGSYVLAMHGGEWTFRQLTRQGEGWFLHALNPARADLPDLPLPDLSAVHGVIIQKAVPGRRRLTRSYL